MADNSSPMFSTPKSDGRSFPTTAVAIAAVAVVLLVGLLVVMGRRDGQTTAALHTLQPAAAYAPNLVLSNLVMSESTSFSGAKDTYVDGHITNNGPATVTGITVQVAFGNVVAEPKRIETTPLMLIRAREPYIDVEGVDAAPLAPGKGADFRLTFESIDPNWDQQLPEVRVIRVSTK
jgi:hypothetical protein